MDAESSVVGPGYGVALSAERVLEVLPLNGAVRLVTPYGSWTAAGRTVHKREAGVTWFGTDASTGVRVRVTVEAGGVDLLIDRARTPDIVGLSDPSGASRLFLSAAPPPQALDADDGVLSPQRTSPSVRPQRSRGDAGSDDLSILIVYTPPVAARYGSALAARLQSAVDGLNLALSETGIAHRARLAGTYGVDYVSSGSRGQDLDRVTLFDGIMDDVHAERERVGADLVALLTDIRYGGVAHIQSDYESGFSVTSAQDIEGVFTHEIGHNIGLVHDVFLEPEPYEWNYARGYTNLDGGFYTIMAYSIECASAEVECVGLRQFSSPDNTYDGWVTGDAAIGDARRRINERFATVASLFEDRLFDDQAPFLAGFDIDPDVVDLGGDRTLQITLRARDNRAGVASVGFRFEGPAGSVAERPLAEAVPTQGDASDGEFVFQIELDERAEPGTWALVYFELVDAQGNAYVTDFDAPINDFEFYGYDDSFEATAAVTGEPGAPAAAPFIRVANPIRETGHITFSTGAAGPASLTLFDLRGRAVARLFGGRSRGTAQSVTLDVTGLAPGAYLLRLRYRGRSVERMVTVVR